ncbi:hypothetical protein DFAR_1040011 [Desulfarculales bacterium]
MDYSIIIHICQRRGPALRAGSYPRRWCSCCSNAGLPTRTRGRRDGHGAGGVEVLPYDLLLKIEIVLPAAQAQELLPASVVQDRLSKTG